MSREPRQQLTLEERRANTVIRTKRYRLRHPERVKARQKVYNAAYYAANREKELRKAKERYHRNWLRYAAQRRERYAKNREAVKAQSREYRKANREKVRAADRIRNTLPKRVAAKAIYRQQKARVITKRVRAWQRKNAAHVEAWYAERRAKKRNISPESRTQITAFIKWARTAKVAECYWCGFDVPRSRRHIDHVIPLARGGRHHRINLCLACAKCNSSRQDKLPSEWRPKHVRKFGE